MAPKKKSKITKSIENTPSNPADAILQHKTKQIVTDNQQALGKNPGDDDEDEDCLSDPMEDEDDNSMDDEDDDDDDEDDDLCLHCQQQHSSQVQVRCDECSAYICNHCHWCHEFQANHEIRVCDRCDAFYCRACDEMDQCDDCGEVVCGTCSTLLSCKFCGGGLCEDCATACGRCGIVLCSRDAKFAVDCDTCRLSYCLVCLASGNKDPCVRCGHRPSKRMEQLVHLRLKSIYKAFKSSTAPTPSSSSVNSATVSSNLNGGGGGGNHSSSSHNGSRKSISHAPRHPALPVPSSNARMRENDDPMMDDLTPSALMLAAAASAAAPSSQLAAAAAAASMAPNLAAATHAAAAGLTAYSGCTGGNGASSSPAASSTFPDPRLTARVSAEMYEAEKLKAEKAAAALLAELDEEEQAFKTKKSKKKKKKAKQQAKKAKEQQKKKKEEEAPASAVVQEQQKHIASATTTTTTTPSESKQPREEKDLPAPTPPPPSPPVKKSDVHHVENTTATTAATASTAASSKAPVEEEKQSPVVPPEEPQVDPMEIEYENLLAVEDVDGLEELLSSIKGVPGKAMLRKNIKKALKRLRTVEEVVAEMADSNEAAEPAPSEELAVPKPFHTNSESLFSPPTTPPGATSRLAQLPPPTTAAPGNMGCGIMPPFPGTVTPVAQSPRVGDLLTIVSQNHNKVSSNSRLPKGHPGTPKSECIMHMAPLIVGWVIGKGGQRIRDLMEESGARIWIDQDSMGPNDPRIVYVSGQRSNVDAAVRMITNLISKAPTDTPNSKQTPTSMANIPESHHSNKSSSSLNFSNVPGLPTSMGLEGSGSVFQLRPREKKKNGDSKAFREMTCDARFVPLLIGRRGWTIKNIQDNSGARVDIDQNVTPRKITISGDETAVKIAARMVGDVLSYPHTLLHGGTADDLDIYPSGEPILEPHGGLDLGLPPRVDEDDDDIAIPFGRALSPGDGELKTKSANSPPSSLIMTADGKSTISATSSLSSTPEPSVSTSMASLAQVPPLLPPEFDQQEPHLPSYPREMMASSFGGFPPASAPPHQSSFHSGLLLQDPAGLGLGPGPGGHPHSTRHPIFMHNSHHGMDSGLGGPPLCHVPPANYDCQLPHGPFLSSPPPDPRVNPMSIHQHTGYPGGLPPLATPDSLGRSLANPPLPGVWDSGQPPNRDGFGHAAPLDFLHYSQDAGLAHSRSPPAIQPLHQRNMSDLIGLQNAPAPSDPGLGMFGLEVRQTTAPLLAGKEDANIVESLFGSSTDPTNDTALVCGLRGLSLDTEQRSGSDLWGTYESSGGFDLPPVGSSSLLGQPQQRHLHELPFNHHHVLAAAVGSSYLFSSTNTDDRQHSRFSWGKSG